MKIAKPLLLVTTPVGVAIGVYEGYRLAGGLVFLMVALLLMISAAIGLLVMTVRREEAAEKARMDSARATAVPSGVVRATAAVSAPMASIRSGAASAVASSVISNGVPS